MRTDLGPQIKEICAKFEIDPAYVKQLVLTPEWATFTIYRGTDGFCEGAKYVVCENDRRITNGVCLCPSGGLTHAPDTSKAATDVYQYRITTT
jgi:hypothetical protein